MSTKKINRLYVLDELEDSIDHLDLSKAVPAQFPNLNEVVPKKWAREIN